MLTGHPQLVLLAVGARALGLLAIGGPLLWQREQTAMITLAVLGVTLVLVVVLERTSPAFARVTPVPEAILIGAVCGHWADQPTAILGALAVPPLVGGLRRGVRGLTWAVLVETIVLVAVVGLGGPGLHPERALAALSWLTTGLGLGLIGAFLHGVVRRGPDPTEPYAYARSLLRQLLDVSGGLDSGLDPQALGGAILAEVRDELPTTALGLYVPREQTVTPLVQRSVGAAPDEAACDAAAVQAWSQGRSVVDGEVFAFPLTTGAETPAVVAGVLSGRLDLARFGLADRIDRLVARLAPSALQLDTALLFLAFRDAASTEERRRLAREMHDGVAQDIASLGYLVDALAARPDAPEVPERIEVLRQRISHVVTEVRQTVANLRTEVGANQSLGAAISGLARGLAESSGLPIRVTLDEQPTRLRPEVEAELLRIAQEAMNNAIKHSRATSVDVHCQVHAPQALISVTDNGVGLQRGRADSHGLKIMRERAMLLGADLYLEEPTTGGLRVSVWVPGRGRSATSPASPSDTKARA